MATPRKTAQPGVTDVSEWKKEADPLLELPSGKFVKARRHGMRTFLAAGIIPNALMGVVEKAINQGVEPDLSQIAGDKKKIEEMMTMVDNIVVFCLLEPRVYAVPKVTEDGQEEERDPRLLYIDEIAEMDKMFIFQWVTGGTTDLEQFRNELDSSVGAISRSQNVGRPTQRARRTTR